jgi:hypothetical protein
LKYKTCGQLCPSIYRRWRKKKKGKKGEALTINRQIRRWVSENDLISTSHAVFAVDLVLAAIDSVTANPNINVPDAILPIITAGRTVVFISQVLAEMERVDDFAHIQLAARSGQCEGIGVCASTAGELVTALLKCYSSARRGIVRKAEVCLFDIIYLLALACRTSVIMRA